MSHASSFLETEGGGPTTRTLPPSDITQDDSLSHDLLEHIHRLRLILPVISISVMVLRCQDAESDTDIAHVPTQHACDPLDCEIERIGSLLASHLWRRQQQGVRT